MSTPTKRLSFLLTFAFLLAGCVTAHAATPALTSNPSPLQVTNPYLPQPGDSSLTGDTATFESAEAAKDGSQVQLKIFYRLPTPCHQVRIEVASPDSTGRINIKLYSVFEAGKPCALMPLSTPLEADLVLGSLPAGHYTVFVNDTQAAAFDE